jgi:manganese efflux pump family protein
LGVLALIIVAASVGLSNMAAAIGLGAGGISRGTRLRVIVIFGVLEAGMPIVGLLLGHGLASTLGRQTKWLAAALLVAVGIYSIVQVVRNPGTAKESRSDEPVKLLLTGLALSLDNLVAGFALGAYQVNVVVGAIVFGAVSVALSLAGLEFGARIGRRLGDSGELLGGVALIGVGAAIGFGALG